MQQGLVIVASETYKEEGTFFHGFFLTLALTQESSKAWIEITSP